MTSKPDVGKVYLRINSIAEGLGGTFTAHDIFRVYVTEYGQINIQQIAKHLSTSYRYISAGHGRGAKRNRGGYYQVKLYRCVDGKRAR